MSHEGRSKRAVSLFYSIVTTAANYELTGQRSRSLSQGRSRMGSSTSLFIVLANEPCIHWYFCPLTHRPIHLWSQSDRQAVKVFYSKCEWFTVPRKLHAEGLSFRRAYFPWQITYLYRHLLQVGENGLERSISHSPTTNHLLSNQP